MTPQAIADLALVADRERRAALRSGNASRLASALAELDSLFAQLEFPDGSKPLAFDKRTA